MSDRIWVATRKGLFAFERTWGTKQTEWQVGAVSFLGDAVSMVLDDGRDGSVHAALDLGHFGVKLRKSTDRGLSWGEQEVPVYPAATGEDGASLEQIWSLEAGGAERPGLLWAGTIPGGLFRSEDGGEHWALVGSLWDREERSEWTGGGYDSPGIHSICVDPRDNDRITVGVSIGGVWCSPDGGATWAPRTDGMRADYVPPELASAPGQQDPHRLVQCPAAPDALWVQHHNGIFRSTDAGVSWEEITKAGPSTFGFAVAVHPGDSDTAWFVPAVKDECRVPVGASLVVTRTRDGGETFDVLRMGLPQENAYHLIYRHGLDVDRDGGALVMGSTTGGLWYSDDQGETWSTIATDLPPVYCVRFGA